MPTDTETWDRAPYRIVVSYALPGRHRTWGCDFCGKRPDLSANKPAGARLALCVTTERRQERTTTGYYDFCTAECEAAWLVQLFIEYENVPVRDLTGPERMEDGLRAMGVT